MSHPFVLGKLALERRETYLKEAENHRIARQAKVERSVQTSPINRLVARLSRLRIGFVRRSQIKAGSRPAMHSRSENENKIPAG